MNAYIDEDGWLCIEPADGSNSQAYALYQWCRENPQIEQCPIIFNVGKEKDIAGTAPKRKGE